MNRRKFLKISLASAGALTAAACGGNSSAAPAEIHFGAGLPLTGGQAREGGLFKKGYELAAKEINDAGGLMIKEFNKKIPVKLTMLDDKSDPTASVQVYEKLATEDKVNFFLGGYSTPLVQAHSIVPQKYSIPYLNGGGSTGEIYQRNNKWIFGLITNIERLATTLIKFIAAQQDAGKLPKPVKIALLVENTSHGKEFVKGVEDAQKASPDRYQVVLNEAFELNIKDADPLMQKLKAANADVFLCDARVADYTTIHRRYVELGLKHKVVSYGPRGPEKAARDAIGAGSNYIVAANWWNSALVDEPSKTFTAKYKAAYANEEPEWFAALGYETARIMFAAVEQAGTLDKTKVRDAIAATKMKPSLVIGGEVSFDTDGQIKNDYMMTQNLPDGKVAVVWPPTLASQAAIVPIP